jgi:hypothetical protein
MIRRVKSDEIDDIVEFVRCITGISPNCQEIRVRLVVARKMLAEV